jgi:hypothetical protein
MTSRKEKFKFISHTKLHIIANPRNSDQTGEKSFQLGQVDHKNIEFTNLGYPSAA